MPRRERPDPGPTARASRSRRPVLLAAFGACVHDAVAPGVPDEHGRSPGRHGRLRAGRRVAVRSGGSDVADSIRRDAQTQWQPVGTYRIDNDPQTVVGPELAVNSVENFMVANATV
ncbi:hypothetical protein ACFY1U_22935 [Streptomyces sp. NPDC001351]|uniref:hypothetical protein n=1 Tax=Streptomyces sp. NPDC001351 TaxID=3364564 RepID=UPI0036BB7260